MGIDFSKPEKKARRIFKYEFKLQNDTVLVEMPRGARRRTDRAAPRRVRARRDESMRWADDGGRE